MLIALEYNCPQFICPTNGAQLYLRLAQISWAEENCSIGSSHLTPTHRRNRDFVEYGPEINCTKGVENTVADDLS